MQVLELSCQERRLDRLGGTIVDKQDSDGHGAVFKRVIQGWKQ
jgi:hypothetical protein